jgi:hypothetical protein
MSTVHLVVLFVSQNCFHSQMTKSTKHVSYWFMGAILSLMVFNICRWTLKIAHTFSFQWQGPLHKLQ